MLLLQQLWPTASHEPAAALAEAVAEPPPPGTLDAQAVAIASAGPVAVPPPARPDTPDAVVAQAAPDTQAAAPEIAPAPSEAALDFAASEEALVVTEQMQVMASVAPAPPAPPKRSAPIFDRVADVPDNATEGEPVVIRLSTSNARHWGVHLGKFNSRSEAERLLLKTQLAESATLNEGLRKVVQKGGGFDANFLGLTQDQADLACRRLQARAVQCFTMGP